MSDTKSTPTKSSSEPAATKPADKSGDTGKSADKSGDTGKSADKSGDTGKTADEGGNAGKSAKGSVGGASQVHYGYFSSVRSGAYRSGWDGIWNSKPNKRRRKTKS